MSIYYFHIHDGGLCKDQEGAEFASLNAAIESATAGAREIMSTAVRTGSLDLRSWIEVEEAGTGKTTVLPFQEVIRIHGTDTPLQP